MAELQKKYSQKAAELKALDEADKKEANKARFQDYKFMVQVFGTHMDKEPTVYDVVDEDREEANISVRAHFVVTGTDSKDGSCYIMMKELTELPKLQVLFARLHAAERIHDKEEKDITKYIKILLGEEE
jgi:hypothetical protein